MTDFALSSFNIGSPWVPETPPAPEAGLNPSPDFAALLAIKRSAADDPPALEEKVGGEARDAVNLVSMASAAEPINQAGILQIDRASVAFEQALATPVAVLSEVAAEKPIKKLIEAPIERLIGESIEQFDEETEEANTYPHDPYYSHGPHDPHYLAAVDTAPLLLAMSVPPPMPRAVEISAINVETEGQSINAVALSSGTASDVRRPEMRAEIGREEIIQQFDPVIGSGLEMTSHPKPPAKEPQQFEVPADALLNAAPTIPNDNASAIPPGSDHELTASSSRSAEKALPGNFGATDFAQRADETDDREIVIVTRTERTGLSASPSPQPERVEPPAAALNIALSAAPHKAEPEKQTVGLTLDNRPWSAAVTLRQDAVDQAFSPVATVSCESAATRPETSRVLAGIVETPIAARRSSALDGPLTVLRAAPRGAVSFRTLLAEPEQESLGLKQIGEMGAAMTGEESNAQSESGLPRPSVELPTLERGGETRGMAPALIHPAFDATMINAGADDRTVIHSKAASFNTPNLRPDGDEPAVEPTVSARAEKLDEKEIAASVRDLPAPAASGTQVAQAIPAAIESRRQIVEQLAGRMIEAGERLTPGEPRTLRLSLRPKELGQVEVSITRDADGRLSAHLAVEHDQAGRTLSDGIVQLREALERTGLQVGRLEVSSGHNLMGNTGGQAGHSGGGQFTRASDREYFELEPAITGSVQTAQDRLLNMHA